MKRLALGFATMALLGGWASPSVAAPVTFEFAGSVTQTNFDPADPFGGSVAFGTAFNGSYTFESTSVDLAPGAVQGSYASFGAPNAFAVNIGGNIFQTTDFVNVGVFNGIAGGSDVYVVLGCAGGFSCPDLAVELFLQDLSGLAFASDALPLAAPPLAAFALAAFGLRSFVDGNQVEILGQLTSLNCREGCVPGVDPTPVPEPSTMLLCLTGLGAACWRRRRLRTGVLAALLLACGTSTAFAVDGVILIDQNRALAGSVTPGDAPGFPVTLSLPGSYRLSGNLTVPKNFDGILIATDHVTLDLNGFIIAGGGNKNGVFNGFVGRLGTVVRNGTVTNFDNGVFLREENDEPASSEVLQIKALKNIVLGIQGSANSIISGNTAIGNEFLGIAAGPHSVVRDNISTGNSRGLVLGVNVLATANNVFGNTFAAITVTCPSVLIGNAFDSLVVLEVGCTFDPLP